jgi:glycosyltransferase involved in cell wall biosynthesis
MRLNWVAYNYRPWDGYGRYSAHMIQALRRAGVEVSPWLGEMTNAPGWMQREIGMDWNNLTISCLPPIYMYGVPGRHWLLSMTEGSEMPDGWVDIINRRNPERIIVPCEANAETFRKGGVRAPVHVIHGGTDPDEFPIVSRETNRPYTFLALADRGARKGWSEVWQAFYKAFERPQDTPDVRLLIKVRPNSNDVTDLIAKAQNPDPRVRIWTEDVATMREVYAACDCFCFPSRFEGWGMPPREAAMMGLPVIVQQHGGLDDGHTREWAQVLPLGTLERIPTIFENIKGEWMKAGIGALAKTMRWCYDNPAEAREYGMNAAAWLREHQTWDHTAGRLLNLIRECG